MGATPKYNLYYPDPDSSFTPGTHDLKSMQNSVDGVLDKFGTQVGEAQDAAQAAAVSADAAQKSIDMVGYSDIGYDVDGVPFIGHVTAQYARGTGSPLGSITPSEKGQIYFDDDLTNGAYMWRADGTGKNSWTCVTGDTGNRNVAGLFDGSNGGSCTLATLRMTENWVWLYCDLTFPDTPPTPWEPFDFGREFAPYTSLYGGGITSYLGDALRSYVVSNGIIRFYSPRSGFRDRFTGMWPRDPGQPWPTSLPGVPA